MQLQTNTILQGGRYRIIDTLGRGGFGITYLAEQVMAKRKVCIKEFFPKDYYKREGDTTILTLASDSFAELMSKYKAKFIKEAQTIATLEHHNVIHVFDVFEENDTAYYVMEYIEGESLRDSIMRRGALSETEAVGHIRQVAAALKYIHSRQIMHLDIKPGNIMLRREDKRVILIDFGLSKHYDEKSGEVTTTTPVGVSHGYAPIEQYQEGGISYFSPQTDIYSLGATLYYLVTAVTPPQAATLINNPLRLPHSLSPTLRNTIEKAMSTMVANRPCSVEELLMLLDKSAETNDKTKTPYEHKTLLPVLNNRWIALVLILFIVAGGIYIGLSDSEQNSGGADIGEPGSEQESFVPISTEPQKKERIKNILTSYYQYVINGDFSRLEQMYAHQINRYYNDRNVSREEVIKRAKEYESTFNVKSNTQRYTIQWNTLKITEDEGRTFVDYDVEYSMEQYGSNKPKYFYIKMHLILNDAYEIVSIYEDIVKRG